MSTLPLSVRCVESIEKYSGMNLFSQVAGLLGQSLQVAEVAAPYIPWIGIAASPFSFLGLTKVINRRWQSIKIAKKWSDRIFWSMQLISCFGGAISKAIKPLVGSLQLSGFRTTGVIDHIFQKVLPVTMLVTGAVGTVASGWALAKRIKDYRILQQVSTVAELKAKYQDDTDRLESAFFPYVSRENFSKVDEKQRMQLLKYGVTFSIYDQASGLLASALSITASVILMISIQHPFLCGGLFIGSTVIELAPTLLKNYLIWKWEKKLDGQEPPGPASIKTCVAPSPDPVVS